MFWSKKKVEKQERKVNKKVYEIVIFLKNKETLTFPNLTKEEAKITIDKIKKAIRSKKRFIVMKEGFLLTKEIVAVFFQINAMAYLYNTKHL